MEKIASWVEENDIRHYINLDKTFSRKTLISKPLTEKES
jgi:hypothetical protein